MNLRPSFLTLILTIASSLSAQASLGSPTPKVEISGKIVEVHKKGPALRLADHHGLSRDQTNADPSGTEAITRRWLKGIRAPEAALFIKKEDIPRLRPGMKIRIKDYSYAISSAGNGTSITFSVYYDKLEIVSGK